MSDNFIYNEGIILYVLKNWNNIKIQHEKIEIKTTGNKWLIPINIIRVDVERAFTWLRDFYCKDGNKHYNLITDLFCNEIRKKDIQLKYCLKKDAFYAIKNTAIKLIVEFLNGDWK